MNYLTINCFFDKTKSSFISKVNEDLLNVINNLPFFIVKKEFKFIDSHRNLWYI